MNDLSAKVTFHFLDVKLFFPNRTALKEYLVSLFRKERKSLHSLTYIFCSDEHLLEMNRNFLQHDYYTDIITFELSPRKVAPVEGEIYISVDRVRDNAARFNTSFKQELHRVVFHGALHLCGYGDKTEGEEKTMRAKEDYYLSRYFSK